MGMSVLLRPPNGTEKKEARISTVNSSNNQVTLNGKPLDYVTDFLFGFLIIPLLYFIWSTSIALLMQPLSIGDGDAIVYIAALTGICYLMSREWFFAFNNNLKTYMCMFAGAAIFAISFYCISHTTKRVLPQIPISYKEMCAKDGTTWVSKNSYPLGVQIDNYAYSSDLNTCLVYEEDSNHGTIADQMIFDIYANKVIASCESSFSCSDLSAKLKLYFP